MKPSTSYGREEAIDMGRRLVNMYRLFLRPLPKDDQR